MDKQYILSMAKEAGLIVHEGQQDRVLFDGNIVDLLGRFAKLVIDDYGNIHANLWLDRCHAYMLAEREACAKVCEDLIAWNMDDPGSTAAKSIRARGNP